MCLGKAAYSKPQWCAIKHTDMIKALGSPALKKHELHETQCSPSFFALGTFVPVILVNIPIN